MKRALTLDAITDGKLYSKNDMVKVGCQDCSGCSACCRDMGDSILLDPFDIHQLTTNLSISFETLLTGQISLHVVDGVILPSIKLIQKTAPLSPNFSLDQSESAASPVTEVCPFLDEDERCSIHAFRPGFCRLFPLGRYYINDSFHYILQNHECPREHKTKVKVEKWLGIPNLKDYETFVTEWHYFLLDIEALLATSEDEAEKKNLSMYLINTFYQKPYDGENFFSDFQERLRTLRRILF